MAEQSDTRAAPARGKPTKTGKGEGRVPATAFGPHRAKRMEVRAPMARILPRRSDADLARLEVERRWGPLIAWEMLRQAELAAWSARHPHQRVMPGTPPAKADPELWIPNPRGPLPLEAARRAQKHVRSTLAILRGRYPPAFLLPLRRLAEGLQGYIRHHRRPAGAPPKARALFARRMLEWAATGLRHGGDPMPKAFEAPDLLLLARCTGIETSEAPDEAVWRKLFRKGQLVPLCPVTAPRHSPSHRRQQGSTGSSLLLVGEKKKSSEGRGGPRRLR